MRGGGIKSPGAFRATLFFKEGFCNALGLKPPLKKELAERKRGRRIFLFTDFFQQIHRFILSFLRSGNA